MIGISKLYCGTVERTVEPSDALRYGRRSSDLPSHLLQFSQDKKPVVVWNVTRACNLNCIHCYARAVDRTHEKELTHDQGLAVIDDLAAFGAPVILFSGGEPLMRPDLTELAKYAVSKGMRAVISTNGTLITRAKANELKKIGLSYVGVSIDGMETVNDRFRGKKGAFKDAMAGITNCQEAGLKVGLRFTINRMNTEEIPYILDLLEEHDIPRVCFYHLVYAGRGSDMVEQDLDHEETRKVVDVIMDRTKDLHDRGISKEVLTVDNHADGPYVYLRMLKENNP
ncbi:MAG: radical SAM protein, partial [Deltaproteobacteria bacterium]|nr:radical SAM protein [Deltaproteobacteria bacterium]